MVLVLDSLVLGGKYLSSAAPAELDRLLGTVRGYAEARVPLRTSVPLLCPYTDEAICADKARASPHRTRTTCTEGRRNGGH